MIATLCAYPYGKQRSMALFPRILDIVLERNEQYPMDLRSLRLVRHDPRTNQCPHNLYFPCWMSHCISHVNSIAKGVIGVQVSKESLQTVDRGIKSLRYTAGDVTSRLGDIPTRFPILRTLDLTQSQVQYSLIERVRVYLLQVES